MKKRTYIRISVLFVVAGAMANAANMVPYEETFESYAAGFTMPGTNGWSAAASSDAVVSTNAASVAALNAYSEPSGYPVSAASHDKVLEVAGTVTNSFGAPAGQTAWVDVMLEAGALSSVDASLLATAHAATYFNYGGHPVVYHYDSGTSSNVWTEIPEITKSGWVRTTVGLDYQTGYFQIKMDGILLTNALGNTSSDGLGSAGGSWFAMPTAASQLNRVVFDGHGGNLDDLIVTMADPFAPILTSLGVFSADVLKLVVDFPNAMVLPESFHPLKSSSLDSPSWASVQHSTNGIDGWVFGNLDYSATEGSSKVIYLKSPEPTAFFRLSE